MRYVKIVLGFVLWLLNAAQSQAWGPLGHEIVAEIAAQHLNPTARHQVELLLGDRAGPAMRQWSNWADEERAKPHKAATGAWHYINFPRTTCSYNAERDCARGRCVVAAIARYSKALQHAPSQTKRAEALKWLIHLVGDIHQPLHAGYADDLGGNRAQVRYEGKGTNLHALLDSQLLATRGLRAVAYARILEQYSSTSPFVQEQNSNAITWASNSCFLVPTVYPKQARVDSQYVLNTRELLEKQLVLAGHRLANLLNSELNKTWRPKQKREKKNKANSH
jgi:hypothetical protein